MDIYCESRKLYVNDKLIEETSKVFMSEKDIETGVNIKDTSGNFEDIAVSFGIHKRKCLFSKKYHYAYDYGYSTIRDGEIKDWYVIKNIHKIDYYSIDMILKRFPADDAIKYLVERGMSFIPELNKSKR